MTQLRGLSRGVSAGVPAAWPRPAALGRLALTRGTSLWWALGLLATLLVTLPAWLPWLDPRLDFRALDDARNHLMRLYHLEWLARRGVWYPALAARPLPGLRLPGLQLLRARLLLPHPGPARGAAPRSLGSVPCGRGAVRRAGGRRGLRLRLRPLGPGRAGRPGRGPLPLRPLRLPGQPLQAGRPPRSARAGPDPLAPAGPVAPVDGEHRRGGPALAGGGHRPGWGGAAAAQPDRPPRRRHGRGVGALSPPGRPGWKEGGGA